MPGTGVALGSSATPDGRFDFIDPNTGVQQSLTPNAGGNGTPAYDAQRRLRAQR